MLKQPDIENSRLDMTLQLFGTLSQKNFDSQLILTNSKTFYHFGTEKNVNAQFAKVLKYIKLCLF